MLKKALLGSAGAAAMLLTLGTAPAAAESDWTLTLDAAVTSDYRYRGISQTDEEPALQIGGTISHSSGFYGGIWGSNIDFGIPDDADIEIDYFVGYNTDIGENLNFDLSAIYYTYPGADDPGAEYDFWEIAAALSTNIEGVDAALTFYYSPEFFGETGNALAVEGSLAYGFAEWFTADIGLGHQDVEIGVDYYYWTVGGTFTHDIFFLDLRYVDTDIKNAPSAADAQFVATIGLSMDFDL